MQRSPLSLHPRRAGLWLALALLTACPASPDGGAADAGRPDDLGAGDGAAAAWSRPRCAAVAGPPYFTLSTDDGVTLLPSAGPVPPAQALFSFSLWATDQRDTLIGAANQALYISRDAGCRYQELTRLPELNDLVYLAAAPGGSVYAYSLGDSNAVQVSGDGQRRVLRLPAPQVRALAVARAGADLLGASDRQSGQLYRSQDGGRTWSPSGAPPPGVNGLLYFTAFDPEDRDHVVVGTVAPSSGANRAGVQVTRDGGRTWTQGVVRGAEGHAINAFDGVINAGDGSRVWLLGLDLDQANGGNGARHLYLSRDGGASFEAQVSGADPGVTLTNGTPLFTPPRQPEVLYFTFSDSLQQNQTFLWRYDAAAARLQARTHVYAQTGELRALAFHPDAPEILYLTRTFQRVR